MYIKRKTASEVVEVQTVILLPSKLVVELESSTIQELNNDLQAKVGLIDNEVITSFNYKFFFV